MQAKYPTIRVALAHHAEGFQVLAHVRRAMRHGGVPNDDIERFLTEAMGGGAAHLREALARWVTVIGPEEQHPGAE